MSAYWNSLALASNFSYSSLETLYLDYVFACSKFGLDHHLHACISKVSDDEQKLSISVKLNHLVDENLDTFTRPVALPENGLFLGLLNLSVSSH